MQGITDPATRASMEKAVRQLERQAPAGRARNPQVTPGVVMPDATSPAVGAATAAGISDRASRAAAAGRQRAGRRIRIAPTPKPSRARSSTR